MELISVKKMGISEPMMGSMSLGLLDYIARIIYSSIKDGKQRNISLKIDVAQ